MKEVITTEDIIDVLHRGLDPNKYDVWANHINSNAVKVYEEEALQDSEIEAGNEPYVLITADTTVLPYSVVEPIEFGVHDTYLVCWYNTEALSVVSDSKMDDPANFQSESVKGLENIPAAVERVFAAAEKASKQSLVVGESYTIDDLKELFPEEDGNIFIGFEEDEEEEETVQTVADVFDSFKNRTEQCGIEYGFTDLGGGCVVIRFALEDPSRHSHDFYAYLTPAGETFTAGDPRMETAEHSQWSVGLYKDDEDMQGGGHEIICDSLATAWLVIRKYLAPGKSYEMAPKSFTGLGEVVFWDGERYQDFNYGEITELQVNDYLSYLIRGHGIELRWEYLSTADRCIELVRSDDRDHHDDQLVCWVTPMNGSFSGILNNKVEFPTTQNTFTLGCYTGEDLRKGTHYSLRSYATLEDVAEAAMSWLIAGK